MPDNKNFLHRIEIIDECFRNNMVKWTLSSLIQKVNELLNDRYGITASKRTIQEDLRYLREEKRAPVVNERDGSTTYLRYSDVNYSIKNTALNSEEVSILSDAIGTLRQLRNLKILDQVEEIIAKLQNTVISNEQENKIVIQFEEHTVASGTQYIDDLFSAIRAKVSLQVRYRSFTARKDTEFIFYPFLLRQYRNRWFVIGRKNTSQEVINLALDRIRRLKIAVDKYSIPDWFDPSTYFSDVVGVSFARKRLAQKVVIKVDASQAPYVLSKPIHRCQQVLCHEPNGDIMISLQLVINKELISVLLGYGNEIEVIEPSSLRYSVATIFQTAANKYLL